jgi:hypothetical protein
LRFPILSNLFRRASYLGVLIGLIAYPPALTALAGDENKEASSSIERDPEKGTITFKFPYGPPLLFYRRLYPPGAEGCVTAKLDLWFDKGQITFSDYVPFSEKGKDYSFSISENDEMTLLLGSSSCRVRVRIDRGDAEKEPHPETVRKSESVASDFPDRPPSRVYRRLYLRPTEGCVSAKLDLWLEHGRYSYSPFVPVRKEKKDFNVAIPENGEATFDIGSPNCRIRVLIDRGE